MNKDQALIQKWLIRLRKDLANSGRLTELSLHLSQDSNINLENWQKTIRSILEEETKPTTELILAIDRWITLRKKKSTTQESDQLDLL